MTQLEQNHEAADEAAPATGIEAGLEGAETPEEVVEAGKKSALDKGRKLVENLSKGMIGLIPDSAVREGIELMPDEFEENLKKGLETHDPDKAIAYLESEEFADANPNAKKLYDALTYVYGEEATLGIMGAWDEKITSAIEQTDRAVSDIEDTLPNLQYQEKYEEMADGLEVHKEDCEVRALEAERKGDTESAEVLWGIVDSQELTIQRVREAASTAPTLDEREEAMFEAMDSHISKIEEQIAIGEQKAAEETDPVRRIEIEKKAKYLREMKKRLIAYEDEISQMVEKERGE